MKSKLNPSPAVQTLLKCVGRWQLRGRNIPKPAARTAGVMVASSPAGDLKVDLLNKSAFMQTFKHALTETRSLQSGVYQIPFDKANPFAC